MEKELENIIESLPPKPPRSRLTPYSELIEEMRTRGWTYRAIARVLAEKCAVRVSPSNLHHFVKAESAKRRPNRTEQAINKELSQVPVRRPTSAADTNQRIAALKQRTSRSGSIETGFEFDPNEPLRLEKVVGSGRDH
jgi:hypothetical protein